MKRQVSQEAVNDLIASSWKLSHWTLKIFKALKPYLSLIEDNCLEVAMDMSLKDMVKRNYFWPNATTEDIEAEKILMLRLINELENYTDKEAVLDAGIAELTEIERKIKRLKKLRPVVRKIFKELDPRTKALFTVYEMMISVDGVTSLDYLDALNVFGDDPVDCLKEYPAMAPLLEAYGLAYEVNRAL